MRVTISQYAKALLDSSKDVPASDQERVVRDFFALLVRRGHTKKLPGILKALERLQDQQDGICRVSVATAFPMTVGVRDEMEAFAKKAFESDFVVLENRTDPALLGGVVLRTENHLIDASVSGKVKRVRNLLTQQ